MNYSKYEANGRQMLPYRYLYLAQDGLASTIEHFQFVWRRECAFQAGKSVHGRTAPQVARLASILESRTGMGQGRLEASQGLQKNML